MQVSPDVFVDIWKVLFCYNTELSFYHQEPLEPVHLQLLQAGDYWKGNWDGAIATYLKVLKIIIN